jgi:hypothetical protein
MPLDERIGSYGTQVIVFLLRVYNWLYKVVEFIVSNSKRIFKAIQREYKPTYYYYCKNSWIPYVSRDVLSRTHLPTLEWVFDVKGMTYRYMLTDDDSTAHKFNFLCVDVVKGEGEEEERACVIGHFQSIQWIGREQPPSAEILLNTICLLDGYWLDLEGITLEITTRNGALRSLPLQQGSATPLSDAPEEGRTDGHANGNADAT